MPAPVRHCTLLGLLLALTLTAVAQAKITPVPKPPGASSGAAASNQSALVAPLAKPLVQTPVQPAPPPSPSQPTTTVLAHPRTAPPTPTSSLGGREQPRSPVLSSGGRHRTTSLPARLVELLPTPLALVGMDESLPASDAWPPWVLTLFTLLLTVEAFLLVRLVRARRFAQDEQLEELPDL
jgi:hypothetical protein